MIINKNIMYLNKSKLATIISLKQNKVNYFVIYLKFAKHEHDIK
jgi:hypothetical protein